MAGIKLEFVANEGAIDKAYQRVERLNLAIRRNATREVMSAANDAVEIMRRLVPVDTGALKADIQVRTVANNFGEIYVIVGPEHQHYAKFVEFGTRFMRAQPFIRPAIDATGPQLRERLRQLGRMALQEI